MATRPERKTAAGLLPERRSINSLRRAADHCTACPIYRNATQTVFGAGSVKAGLMLVGETPGDREDVEGKPFVGPAGRLLDEALAAAGIGRRDVYVTNTVKHFKWESSARPCFPDTGVAIGTRGSYGCGSAPA